MRRTIFLTAAMFFFVTAVAQVRVEPLAQPGYEKRIKDFVANVMVVDTHEHLLNPAGFDKSMLDFMLLFRHYAAGDFQSVGFKREKFNQLLTDSLPLRKKWHILENYWERTSNTAYNRAILLAAKELFGIEKIDETTVEELSEKIRKAYEKDWYTEVLKKRCRIEYVIEDYPFADWENRSLGDPEMYKYVKKFDRFINIHARREIEILAQKKGGGISTLGDLVTALGTDFRQAVKEGIVAVKTILAYHRTLHYEEVNKEEAEKIFTRLMNSNGDKSFPFVEVKPLQDYMMHRVLDLARDSGLPVQMHTGLNSAYITNSNPTHLTNLFLKYPEVPFILFHGGYPYGGELATLAKNFRNVYIDLCWLYIISPSFSERYLHEWLETVPAGKIMAFGGDFMYVENVYSHLLFARQVVSNVLIEKVSDGYFSEDEALKIARMLFHDNAVRILNLEQHQ
jgi:uncharacterized protein